MGSVRSVNCANGTLSVLVHLPAGSESFNVTATSTKNDISSSSGPVTFTRTTFACPTGYVGVPGSGFVGLGNASASANNSAANSNANWWIDVNRDFCVMKYPAKNNGSSFAVSTTAGTPWASITRDSALTTCAAVGPNYRLISNTQWQTVARNCESVAANWSGNAVGSGSMARGHTDTSPARVLENASDNDPYFGTGNSGAAWNTLGATPSAGAEQRRTRILSNGEVVWDFGGNVWQLASDNYSDLGLSPTIEANWVEFSNTTSFPRASPAINRSLFAPLSVYASDQIMDGVFGGSGGAVVRGGDWGSDLPGASLFSAILEITGSEPFDVIGFRCVFLP